MCDLINDKVIINKKVKDYKKNLGQFFTVTNPFDIEIFFEWFNLIPKKKKEVLLEPFAGANNIVRMIQEIGIISNWVCYDISPNENNVVPECNIIKQDTIKNHPKGYYVGITNPPYLAKNSATRAKMDFPITEYDDLYKVALDLMLNNLDYVAAIIPDSFINSELFSNRLYAYISLTCKMFEDTDCPVCLALFIPDEQKIDIGLEIDDFYVYIQDKKIGLYSELKMEQSKICTDLDINWKFNDKEGEIGICCIDNITEASIRFMVGDEINPSNIKISSRTYTRVSGLPEDIDIKQFLERCNEKISTYRDKTYDVFLTSFKNLRKDNRYRRRLDFKTAKLIMNSVIYDIRYDVDKNS